MPTRERLWFLLLVAAAFICVSLPGCWRGTVQQRNSVSLSDEEMLVVTSEDGIAFVDFLSFAPTGEEESKYRWRYLDTRTGEEQSGEGVVFEKYDKVRTGPNTYRVKDAGGQLLVKAGF